MQNVKKMFKDSAAELKKVKSLAMAAMLLAIACVIGFFAIQLTESIKISFAFLVDELTGAMFGPVVGAVEGGLADLLKFFIHPTGPYFPGFTISEIVTGLLYGILLYRKPITLKRVILANTTVMLLVNVLMNTAWLQMMYGNAFLVMLPARLLKELIILPINIALFYALHKLLGKAKLVKAVGRA